MPLPAETLRKLHHIHQILSDLRERLDRGPKQIAARAANVARIEEQVQHAHEHVLQTKKKVDQKQLDLKSVEMRIGDWKAKLNVCSSNKEYQALLEQIAAAEMANSVLEDEILEGLDLIEVAEGKQRAIEEELQRGMSELERVKKSVADESSTIRADIEREEGKLAEVESALPNEFRPDYKRLVAARGADALAPVEDGYCEGCGQHVTLNMQNDLKIGKTLLLCSSCGRMAYLRADGNT